jgi:hypothetical protein
MVLPKSLQSSVYFFYYRSKTMKTQISVSGQPGHRTGWLWPGSFEGGRAGLRPKTVLPDIGAPAAFKPFAPRGVELADVLLDPVDAGEIEIGQLGHAFEPENELGRILFPQRGRETPRKPAISLERVEYSTAPRKISDN